MEQPWYVATLDESVLATGDGIGEGVRAGMAVGAFVGAGVEPRGVAVPIGVGSPPPGLEDGSEPPVPGGAVVAPALGEVGVPPADGVPPVPGGVTGEVTDGVEAPPFVPPPEHATPNISGTSINVYRLIGIIRRLRPFSAGS